MPKNLTGTKLMSVTHLRHLHKHRPVLIQTLFDLEKPHKLYACTRNPLIGFLHVLLGSTPTVQAVASKMFKDFQGKTVDD